MFYSSACVFDRDLFQDDTRSSDGNGPIVVVEDCSQICMNNNLCNHSSICASKNGLDVGAHQNLWVVQTYKKDIGNRRGVHLFQFRFTDLCIC